jgi:flagellar assembly factor FliW
MRVITKASGPVDVDERQQIHFPAGILGFENLRDYVLLDAAQPPFYWLQSLDVVEIAFILINPRIFRPDYSLEVDPAELQALGVTAEEQILDFAIVTIPEDPMEMTANLQGPILINRTTRTGRQTISTDPTRQVRHPILKELATLGHERC